jgi:hypothetical protein
MTRRHGEVSAIERHDRIRPNVHRGFQHHVVVRVRQRRSPKEIEQYRM